MPRGLPLPNLRHWRHWRGYSQAELAERAGLTRPTVTNLEAEKAAANFATVRKLAEALGITREQLLHDEPGKEGG